MIRTFKTPKAAMRAADKPIAVPQTGRGQPFLAGGNQSVTLRPGSSVTAEQAPVGGVWVNVTSSMVKRANWSGQNFGYLIVEYKWGFRAGYKRISRAMWLSFLNAPSKGRWVHDNIWHMPYDAL